MEGLTALDNYYAKHNELTRECLLALKTIILAIDKNIVHTRKYQIPFFCCNDYNLGFLWVNRKKILVGFIEDKKIFTEYRKDNVTMLEINPLEDIPVEKIRIKYQSIIEKIRTICANSCNLRSKSWKQRTKSGFSCATNFGGIMPENLPTADSRQYQKVGNAEK
ncbi:MAG: DUF1801 domain-containing protein [Prevotellaceae bacterium]|jgi:hypothetical protein|nr:DUF1801 domain-containing protein [Prevotellaceae bacterium]